MARRDDREYREYLRKEQRRQPGCPARKAVLNQRRQATSFEQPPFPFLGERRHLRRIATKLRASGIDALEKADVSVTNLTLLGLQQAVVVIASQTGGNMQR
jgi:hypothetical protein